MLHERRNQIVERITANRMVKVADLTRDFNVSIETIRRDLEFLEDRGYLKRVYGGAVLNGAYGLEPSYELREVINLAEKQAIAAKCVEFIDDGDTLIIDLGTTTLEVTRRLAAKKNLTVITNATLIAQVAVNFDCRVILLGGNLRRGELATSGFLCEEAMRNFFANKLIMGVGGVTLEGGVTDYVVDEAQARRTMLERVDKVIAVADYSKFGVTALNGICPVSRLEALVVDSGVPAKTLAEYRAAGVKIAVAQMPGGR